MVFSSYPFCPLYGIGTHFVLGFYIIIASCRYSFTLCYVEVLLRITKTLFEIQLMLLLLLQNNNGSTLS